MKAVIVEIEEGNRHIGSNRIPLAQAHPIEHRTSIEHAAEGTKQGEKGLRCETNPVAPGFDRSIVQMADGASNRFADAALNIQLAATKTQTNSTSTAGLATCFFRSGVEIKAGLGALHLTECSFTVEIEALG